MTRHETPKILNTRVMMAHVDQGPFLFAIFLCVAVWMFIGKIATVAIGTVAAIVLFGVLYALLLFAATRDELFVMMLVVSMFQRPWYDPAE